MRVLRIVLTLVFGLVVAGPETHACPVHDQMPTHAHMNLLGWVSMALFGLIYQAFPAAGQTTPLSSPLLPR